MPGKIIDKIRQQQQTGEPFFSIEFFPPRTTAGAVNLFSRFDRMARGGPLFIDITWGAGGGDPAALDPDNPTSSISVAQSAINYCGLDTMLHLTCANNTKKEIHDILIRAKSVGIRNILALRGDPPVGVEKWVAPVDGFDYATDLVRFIREEFGDYFGICVAGYPNGHPDCTSLDDDILHLKEKVDAGADFVITQLFFEVSTFVTFVQKCRAIGVECPIVPGILPIQSAASLRHLSKLSKLAPPPDIANAVNSMKDDDRAIREYGIGIAAKMCKDLAKTGLAPGFHFYCLNREVAVRDICKKIGIWKSQKRPCKDLPWLTSANDKRQSEGVRPIFWQWRPKSYMLRTKTWDDFPNGRWGDSSSPAFGDLSGYHIFATPTVIDKQELVAMWGQPKCPEDVYQIFVKFITRDPSVTKLPWVESSELSKETVPLMNELARLNNHGILTTNSQPAVNGLPSDDEVHGWGGTNGFVFQKCYLEFFISQSVFDQLLEVMQLYPMMTYYAMNHDGSISHTNNSSMSPNAVTWGIFPGKEVIQPTVVDPMSFPIWKDEAFGLWKSEWASLYEPDTEPRNVINQIHDNYLLVNIVDNNFIDCKMFEMFECLFSKLGFRNPEIAR
eukprot:CAMPEP_0184343492 /NCGR_PEP_ID=MMETSP1089-20130417/12000_1 /TAXON_ID=38269 ORGANISM="Gloeochaete wittrockiana, Strain SAG46.84" /NCGR_SAMPLE_ID=MMETSP1089 /ASSEMBLY_ACC=CAM_ASM_000445 /LENGTH=614 /DNA_ID=CAMNT_0026672801 /DNA_START=136 /DNA_END=1980 /DNA_ORIENTATION=+